MEEKEIWKSIKDYYGLYEVSNLGQVRSIDREIIYSNGKNVIHKGKILIYNVLHGYNHVFLSKNSNVRRYRVHRLVCEAFLPNPEKKATVNHKDGNPSNNKLSNLEWATQSENNRHSYRELGKKPSSGMLGRLGKDNPSSRPVIQLDLIGNFIARYYAQREAERETGVYQGNIYKCCVGKAKTAGGFIWRYETE